ncbi:MAG: phosphotransferase [Deltaproteobacteria bacterium]|nr:phosphotransferase [Deltaproteobacteria bacterium]
MNVPLLSIMKDLLSSGYRVTRETLRVFSDALDNDPNSQIPPCADSISPEWLTSVMQVHAQDVRVESVEPVSEHFGTTTHVRISVTYNRAGEEAGLPKSFFLKLRPREVATRIFVSLMNLPQAETKFYNDISPQIASLVPKVYYARAKDRGSRFVILMEDLDAGNYYTKDVTNPCTLEEARMVVRSLGQIHGRFWNSPRFKEDLDWLLIYENDPNIRLNRLMRKMAFRRVISNFDDVIPDQLKQSCGFIDESYDFLETYWSNPPHTLLHGDPHLGNLYFGKQGVGFFDWQVVRRGQGMRDVAYFIIQSLATDLRRGHEKALIQLYLDSLAASGVSGPTFEKAWEQYRLHAFYAWIAVVITAAAGSSLQSEAIGRTGLKCVGTALIDLDSIGILKSVREIGNRSGLK